MAPSDKENNTKEGIKFFAGFGVTSLFIMKLQKPACILDGFAELISAL
jgi:hypothetical protein